MIQKMHLDEKYYNLIKEGTKTIEMRLNDEKRRLLNVGDILEFQNRTTSEVCRTVITNLYKYPSFEEVYNNFDKGTIGYYEDEEANYQDMEKYYSKEEQEKYGVLAIEIKVID